VVAGSGHRAGNCRARPRVGASAQRSTRLVRQEKWRLSRGPLIFRFLLPSYPLVEKLPTLAVSAVERMLLDSGVILEAAIRYIQHSSAA
jgi:hypothetical protein